ncbi:MAG: hypothetical protein HN370_07435 [Phycisphaerales bacterium]|nr:hypothetical protein [Phycisphaerales bacterium]
MKRLMMVAVLLAMASPSMAALCKKCNGQPTIMSIGQCTACKGHTSSGANKLCPKCSVKQGKCERCLVALKPAKNPAPKPAPGIAAGGGCVQPPKLPAKPAPFKKQSWGEYSKDRAPMAKVKTLLGGNDFIADAETFAKVWKALNGKKAAPKIEWKSELVLYFSVIANNRLRPFVKNTKGAVQARAMSTRMGGPGFRWAMETYSRKGVKTVNGKAVPAAKAVTKKVPTGGKAINLDEKNNGKTVAAQVGDTILIKLDSNPSTGYGWKQGDQPKGSAVEFKSKKFLTASQMNSEMRPMPGQGGATTFTYLVVKPGKVKIDLNYRRPWEKTKPAAKTVQVTIDAKKAVVDGPAVTGKLVFSTPPDVKKISRIVVEIRNVALMDGPAPLIGQVELKGPFTLPVKFAIPYDASKVRPNPRFYALSARVYTEAGGKEKLYFINDTRHSILTKAGDTAKDIKVKKL